MPDKFEIPKEISEFLSITPENLDDFKEKFEKDFIRKDKIGDDKDLLAPHFGKAVGEIETKLRSAAKEFGVDLGDEGIPKGTKTTEVADILFKKAAELRDAKITELEGKIKASSNDDVAKVQKEFEDFKVSAKKQYEELEVLKNDAVTKYGELEATTNEKFKTIKLDTLKGESNSKIKWATESEGFELKKKGFDAHMNEKYQTSLSENGEFIVTDANGERIKDEKVTGQYKSYDAILLDEATKAGIIKINPNGGDPIKKPSFVKDVAPVEGETKRNINRSTR